MPKSSTRSDILGRTLEFRPDLAVLEVRTHVPHKWVLVDTETGECWSPNVAVGWWRWRRSEPVQVRAAAEALRRLEGQP